MAQKIVTIKQNTIFRRVYSRGKSYVNPALVTYVLGKNRVGICRIGITASKKIGNAVERNRCTRIIRAAYASLADECIGSYDIVFVVRFKTKRMKSTQIAAIMRKQLVNAGVIKE